MASPTIDAAPKVALGEVRILTVPSGAVVTINGNARGTAPISLRLARGTRISIMADLNGFVSASQTTTVGDGTQDIALTLVPKPAAIVIDAGVPDAPTAADRASIKTPKIPKPSTKDPSRAGTDARTGSASYNPNDVGGD